MSVIFAQKSELSLSVEGQWLTISDLVQLDSALCNGKLRSKYFNNFESTAYFEEILPPDAVYPLSFVLLTWAENRCFDAAKLFTRLQINDHCVAKFKEASSEHKARLVSHLGEVQYLSLDVNFLDVIEVLVHCTNVKEVVVTNAATAVVESLAAHCPRLQSCDLSGSEDLLSEHAILSLCLRCPDLTSLNVSNCSAVGGHLLRAILTHCPHLTALNVQDCRNVTDRDIMMLGLHCRGLLSKFIFNGLSNLALRTLVWSKGCRVDALDLSFNSDTLTDCAIREVGAACPHLTSVSLYQCSRITDAGLVALVSSTPLLTSLNIEGLDQVTDTSLKAVTSHCPQLSELFLNYNVHITSIGLVTIAALAKTLRRLSLLDVSLSDETLIAIISDCSDLTALEVSYNKNITDKSLLVVAERCRRLTKLHLAYCTQVTDASLTVIAENCEALESLDVSRCTSLTDKTLLAITSKHTHMRELRLLCNHHISTDALKTIGARLIHLTKLALADQHVNNDVLVAVLSNCKLLTDLDVGINNKVTDETFKVIAPLCGNLRRLSVRECDYVTNAALYHLSNYCESLSYLDVSGCSMVTLGGLHVVQDACSSGKLKVDHDDCELIAEEEEKLAEQVGEGDGSDCMIPGPDRDFQGF